MVVERRLERLGVGGDVEPVDAGFADDRLAAQDRPQPGDMGREGRVGRRRRVVPQGVDELVAVDGARPCGGERREQPALHGAPDRLDIAVDLDRHGAQDQDPHHDPQPIQDKRLPSERAAANQPQTTRATMTTFPDKEARRAHRPRTAR